MEILTKPKPWRARLSEMPVDGSITADYSDAHGIRRAIWRMKEYEFTTEKVEVTITAKKSGVETQQTCLVVTRIK